MKQFLRRNSSTILTCAGAIGVVATSVMAVKATPKALTLIDKATEEKGEKLTKFEVIKVAGPTYVPTVISGAATIACIFGSNVISKRQQANLMSAYALLDTSYKEYRKKVDELYGEEAGKQVRSEIAKDKYTGDGVLLDDETELFYDFYSGRHFESTKEKVLRAEYMLNRALYVHYSVSLNEFYEFLGLEQRPEYEGLGWSCGQIEEMYWHNWIEFDHEETVLDEDADGHEGLVCTIINMPYPPYIDYEYY
jgi:hypothetical protein